MANILVKRRKEDIQENRRKGWKTCDQRKHLHSTNKLLFLLFFQSILCKFKKYMKIHEDNHLNVEVPYANGPGRLLVLLFSQMSQRYFTFSRLISVQVT